MSVDYRELAEKYLRIAKRIAEGFRMDEDVLGCAAYGSVARGDVHPKSDVDLLVLVEGDSVYRWERRVVRDVVVNIALRSQDVLERMAKEEPYTIWGLQEARILYDPRGILAALKGDAKMTTEVEEEFLGDLLDEGRPLIGKAERALDEDDLESGLLWLRRGAMEPAELIFYKEKGRRIRLFHFWQEIQVLPSTEFRELFAKIQGLHAMGKGELGEMLQELGAFLPKLE